MTREGTKAPEEDRVPSVEERGRRAAEDALREAEERFRTAFENAAIGMSMTSTDGRFLRVNPALCQMLGYAEDELTGKRIRDLTHPDHITADEDAMRRMRSGEQARYRTEKRYLRRDGEPVWISLSSSTVRDADGTVLYFLSQMEDISERKLVETERREALERLRAVTQAASDAIISADEHSRIVFWNESAEATFGYTADEVLGHPLTMLMPERLREAHLAGIARLRETGEPRLLGKTVELEGLRKDGTTFPLELSLGGWEAEEHWHFTGVVRDITERKRAERYVSAQFHVAEILAESPSRDEAGPRLLAAIGGTMGWKAGGLWKIDGDILWCETFWKAENAQVAQFETASWETTLTRGIGLPGRVWESGRPVWVRNAGREPNFPRARMALHDGLRGAIGVPIRGGGEVLAVFDFYKEAMTDPAAGLLEMMDTIGTQVGQFFKRKEAEERLAASAAELERRAAALARSNADLEQFAYVASHDLSEPLRQVSGFARLLSDRYSRQLDEEGREFLRFTVDGADHMQALIDDLLAFSRVGRAGMTPSLVDCGRVVQRARDALAVTIAESGGEIEVERLPQVIGHERELSQLFQNLLSNALKFHDEAPPHVGVRALRQDDAWLFEVRDNGVGVEPGQEERIFKMFQRLHGQDTYPGTGIGLAICKKIVEGHGGRIWVEPATGGGSVFKFTLPAGEGR